MTFLKNILIVYALLLYAHYSHAGIHFIKVESINTALEIAQQENKPIFLDFYATWCAPCKVMDEIFEHPEVATYFNTHFINVKVDVDQPSGTNISSAYEVVFLPTLVILNKDGNLNTKIDKLLTANDLINIAKESLNGKNRRVIGTLNDSPFPSSEVQKNADIDPNSKEEVIYIHDNRASSGRPHIMYHEAYLHLQLMDGKHHRVVKKYLSTQDDWTLEKNIKFIFDFTQNANTDLFEFLIANKHRFEEIIGKEKVATSISILVQQRLDRGFPRPNLNEALKLYKYIDTAGHEEKAYVFYMQRLLSEEKLFEFYNTAKKYLLVINPYNHDIIQKYVTVGLGRSNYKQHIEEYIGLMNTAVSIAPDEDILYYELARLHFINNNAEPARELIEKAISLAQTNNSDFAAYLELKEKIMSL